MNRKVLIGFFCFSCVVFAIGVLMNIFINPLSCDEGYNLRDGKCYKYEYVSYLSNTCKSGYVLHEGKCYKYLKYNDFDKYKTCEISKTDENIELSYKDGKCLITEFYSGNLKYTCDDGFGLNNNNVCYKETTIDATLNEDDDYVCPSGYAINDKICKKTDYRDPVRSVFCTSDTHVLKDDYCYLETETKEAEACLKGETLIDDKCYVLSEETIKPTSVCPYGYTESDGQCKKEFIKEANKKH